LKISKLLHRTQANGNLYPLGEINLPIYYLKMAKKRKSKQNQQQFKLTDHVTKDEDEEIDEDEAFNSEDERRYGALFSSSKKEKSTKITDSSDGEGNGSESESNDDDSDDNSDSDDEGIASDDEEEEGDGGQYMLDLLNKIDTSTPKHKKEEEENNNLSYVKESEFAASVLKNEEITMEDLMTDLQDTKEFSAVQKTYQQVKKGKTTSTPIAKVVSSRIQRKVGYGNTKEDITGWVEVVQQNRQAETLDFRPKERVDILTKNKLIDKFEPTTKFEKELAEALELAGQQDEETLQKRESSELVDELESNELTLEEYQQRRGQLAKMRALMFYHEQKRHHINKIKSKKYRRIRKKQRERVKEAELSAQMEDGDTDLVHEMEEKEEIDRMKERMTLAHKNIGKWAKRVIKRGKNVDMDTRKALSAQLHRGEELRRKMNSTIAGENSDSDSDDDEDLAEAARNILAETEADAADKVAGKGLFKLSFMRKGLEKQRERANQEARELLLELQDDGGDDGDESEEEEIKARNKKKKKKVASAADMAGVLEEGKLVANLLNFGNSSTLAVDGVIDIDIDSSGFTGSQTLPLKTPSPDSHNESTLPDVPAAEKVMKGKKTQKKKPKTGAKGTQTQEAAAKEKKSKETSEKEKMSEATAAATEDGGKKNRKKKKKKNSNIQENDQKNGCIVKNSNNTVNTSITTLSEKQLDSQNKTTILEVSGNENSKGKNKSKNKKKTTQVREVVTTKKEEEANPWMSAVMGKKNKRKKRNTQQSKKVDKNGIVDMEGTASIILTTNQKSSNSLDDSNDKESVNKGTADKSIVSLTQSELVKRAFVTPNEEDIDEEFAKEKAEAEEGDESDGKKLKKNTGPETVDGWGSWTGIGAPPPPKKPEEKAPLKKEKKRKRNDEKRPNLIMNEKRLKKTAKFQIAHIPHPYKSREEYERAMSGAIGKEWNVTSSFKSLTRPDVITRIGKIIQPISKRAKQPRAPAKF